MYRQLLNRADLVTTLSPENLKVARQVLPSVRCECVLTGTVVQKNEPVHRNPVHRPVRIASLGTDMNRDWKTLTEAFGDFPGYEVRIGSTKVSRRVIKGLNNIAILPARTAEDVRALYEWADFVAVSLKPNLHASASGITVAFEAIASAVPVICTDTGGMRAYFSEAEIAYVPPFAPAAMRRMAEQLSRDDNRRFNMVVSAQHRLLSAELTAEGFAMRNRRLSEGLL
jgi:glycosyltransferase involved in cell wall biosynthesis